MELRPAQFARQLAAEPLRPVYLVAGSEPLLVQEAADAVRARAREQGFGEREVYDVDADFDWNRLSQGMASMSLFATHRLFELRMPTGRPGKEGGEALREFCENPPPDTVLLVTSQEWSKKHAGKWSEAIARAGDVVRFPADSSLPDPYVQPAVPGVVVTPLPGVATRIAIPMTAAGEIVFTARRFRTQEANRTDAQTHRWSSAQGQIDAEIALYASQPLLSAKA